MEFLLYVAALKGLDKKTAKERSENLLEQVNLEKDAKRKVKTYSGGNEEETWNSTDQIIFSSVSKEKLFIAKTLAGLSMGTILAAYLYCALSVCSFGIYGFSGFNAPLQIRIPGCMLNITIGQTYIYLAVLFLIAGFYIFRICNVFITSVK